MQVNGFGPDMRPVPKRTNVGPEGADLPGAGVFADTVMRVKRSEVLS